MNNSSSLKVKVQKIGTSLSNMVMPNIGAFIAWGLITSLFIKTGWMPNEKLSTMVDPILKFLLPIMIGYTGGYNVYKQRGGVIGAMGTIGAILGTTVPMFIGAMIMGPLSAWLLKKFDDTFKEKIPTGFEMLVNNFSAGIIGFALILSAFLAIGPVVEVLTQAIGNGVQVIVDAKLLPLANVLVEPAKILFLNNAINHGIFTPLAAEQVLATGKSILYMVESNPGPGLGLLLAFAFFGKGSAKSSSWGAMIIHFFGGIHEIYFPYVMMKPALFLAMIAGGISGTFTFQLLGAGLTGAASPGSIIAYLAVTEKSSYLAMFAGVLVGALVTFFVASVILKADKTEGDDLAEAQAATKAAKAQAKGQAVPVSAEISTDSVKQIIFACDAGMGSSAMGASLLRDKVKKAGLDIPVTNKAISTLEDTDYTLIVTQEELTPRATQRTPRAIHVSVDNFLTSPKYDEIVAKLTDKGSVEKKSEAAVASTTTVDMSTVKEVVFAYDKGQGSATMGKETLLTILKAHGAQLPVTTLPFDELSTVDAATTLVIVPTNLKDQVLHLAPQLQILGVESLVTTPEYDKLVAQL